MDSGLACWRTRPGMTAMMAGSTVDDTHDTESALR
jgi:hypothetical protein